MYMHLIVHALKVIADVAYTAISYDRELIGGYLSLARSHRDDYPLAKAYPTKISAKSEAI